MRLRQVGQPRAQVQQPRLHRLAVEEAGAVFHVDTIGAGVLADDQQFLHARLEQGSRIAEHVAHRPRHQVAAHAGDDAEGAPVVAALADLEVGVMPRRELDPGGRHQVRERVVRPRHVPVHRIHHLLRGVGARHGQHLGVHLLHQVAATLARLGAQATGDDDAAVERQGLADGVQALLHRVVDEAAGVDDDEVCAFVLLARLVAFGAQLGQDELGIGQRLRAAERDESDGGRLGRGSGRGGVVGYGSGHGAILGHRARCPPAPTSWPAGSPACPGTACRRAAASRTSRGFARRNPSSGSAAWGPGR